MLDTSVKGLAVTFFLAVVSPLLIATITNKHMSSQLKLLISIIVTAVCVLVGQFFDKSFQFPPDPAFWILLTATFGAQQFAYNVGKDNVVKTVQDKTEPVPPAS